MTKRVFVVGGGPSLKDFPWGKLYDKDVIAVNMAIFSLPTAKHFITMDYTFLRKSRIQCGGENSRGVRWQYFDSVPAEKNFLLAITPENRIKIEDKVYQDKKYNLRYNLRLFDRVIEVASYGGASTSFEDFRSGSESGFAGLQLASVLGYTEIFLLGFDFTAEGGTHYHSEYEKPDPTQYNERLMEFLIPYPRAITELSQRGVQVTSLSPISKLNNLITYVPWENVL